MLHRSWWSSASLLRARMGMRGRAALGVIASRGKYASLEISYYSRLSTRKVIKSTVKVVDLLRNLDLCCRLMPLIKLVESLAKVLNKYKYI